MPLRRRRSQYQQLAKFERSRVIGLREGGFSFRGIAERLERNVFAVNDCFETTVTQRTVSNRLLQGQPRARCPVACIPLTLSHCRLRRQWCQARARWRTEWRSVVFSDESRFCLGASDGRMLSVDMLHWPTRSTDLSLIEYVWDIIGRQFQHQPQPALTTIPVLIQQV
ncbi:transposable element Tc1 transposase [Trichonephila clavipes]|nr:transposable element Tc1 transposase [Trichonephila clavipes]